MKKLFLKAKEKVIEFFKWVWAECKDWHTIALLGVVALAVSFPIWMGYILYFIFRWNWALVAATAMWAFWLLPGAPFFTVTVAITLAIKKIYEKRKEKLEHREEESDTAEKTAEPEGESENTESESDITDKTDTASREAAPEEAEAVENTELAEQDLLDDGSDRDE